MAVQQEAKKEAEKNIKKDKTIKAANLMQDIKEVQKRMQKDGMSTGAIMNYIDSLIKENESSGGISKSELKKLLDTVPRGNIREEKAKEKKPKKNPIGADLMYASKGGMASKKSKVAGKLALRGYGRAMKGKK
tara:strand:+ start:112 stop:510 length:399 start_codon:yes stop_codon:yes gene_type:complete